MMLAGAFSGCTKSADTGSKENTETEASDDAMQSADAGSSTEESTEEGLSDDTYRAIADGEGTITAFIGEPFYDGVVKDETDALAAINSVLKEIGGDETTELELVDMTESSEGTVYYSFRQFAGDVTVYGATVKLIVDKDGRAIGLVSALVPNLDVSKMEDWAITAEEAEAIVLKEYQDENVRLVPGATEQTLLPVEDSPTMFSCIWVVYSNNFAWDVDAAFLAHYVDQDGNLLYSTPVTEPGNAEALDGGAAVFAFDGYDADTWSGTVKLLNGGTMDVTIPVLVDKETGDVVLGDAERKIMLADYTEFFDNDTLKPCVMGSDDLSDEWIITFRKFLDIYDLYKTTGLNGPDGRGTPCLLLMNAVDENGEPMDNAMYSTKIQGFQVFAFDSTLPYGEATDIVGHEFTHCFTSEAMTSNLYLNDYGAINEAMSDVLGNLAAMMVDEKDVPYEIGEQMGEAMRYMNDPHKGQQPAYVWDIYYLPTAAYSTDNNDNGGVHENSSLLNWVSCRLAEAGMPAEDEFYYWMNVSYAMTPRTDYPQLSLILPWVMKNLGYDKYLDALDKAIKETRMETHDLPETLEEGTGMVALPYPYDSVLGNYNTDAYFVNVETDETVSTYPWVEREYIIVPLTTGNWIFYMMMEDPESDEIWYVSPGEDGWSIWPSEKEEEALDAISDPEEGHVITVTDGELIELDEKPLVELMEK